MIVNKLLGRHRYYLHFGLPTTTSTTTTTTTTTFQAIVVGKSSVMFFSGLLLVLILAGALGLAYLYRSLKLHTHYTEPVLHKLDEDDPVFESLRNLFQSVDSSDLGRGRDVRDRRR